MGSGLALQTGDPGLEQGCPYPGIYVCAHACADLLHLIYWSLHASLQVGSNGQVKVLMQENPTVYTALVSPASELMPLPFL